MDFFSIGSAEVLLTLIVALIILGPGRVVEVGRTLGKIARALRKASFDLTAQVTKEFESEEKDHPPQPERKTSSKTKESVTLKK